MLAWLRRKPNLYILAGVWLANAVVWYALIPADPPAPAMGKLHGASYSPYRDGHDPAKGLFPDARQIDEDLAALARHFEAVRTYSSSNGQQYIPGLAGRHGLRVVAGAWLARDETENRQEIANLIHSVNRWERSVESVIVGNETLLRGDLEPDQLLRYLRLAKRHLAVPVSTAEPYHVWETLAAEHPEFIEACDYLAVHLLPYWEGVPIEQAVDHVVRGFKRLQDRFPDKPIVIAEVGWPAGGWRFGASVPTPYNQERFVREFLAVAQRELPAVPYFLMEAFDQPWKTEEGTVGAHWGLFTVDRQPKFDWARPSRARVPWLLQFTAASGLGLALAWLAARRLERDVRTPGRAVLSVLIQGVVSAAIFAALLAFDRSQGWGTRASWLIVWPAQALMYAVVLVQGWELVELLWRARWRRKTHEARRQVAPSYPKVSIHVPVCREPPELVRQTLQALAALDYPDFEVLLISNNTSDPAQWQPLEHLCQQLGPRFRFFHLERWPGYKAGALNFALKQTAPDAAVIGVIDSDYVVHPDWLRKMVPHFSDARVAIVQAPQDHRDWQGRLFQTMLNWEYAGFFHLGMVQRNEHNAIIQHGTMTLVRRKSLEEVGGWATWCICEDAELGLRILEQGGQAVYLNQTLGRGVVPDSFLAYKIQRCRWAYGAMQILRGHWRQLLPWSAGRLTLAQRYHFVAGWLPWIGDALGLVFTAGLLLWTAGMVLWPYAIGLPTAPMIVPMLVASLFGLARTIWLYSALVPCSLRQRLGAAVAGLSLSYTIGRACLAGLFTSSRPFGRTPKDRSQLDLKKCLRDVREELLVFSLLWLAFLLMIVVYPAGRPATKLWLAALALQSVPCAASIACSLIGGAPSFAPHGIRHYLLRLPAVVWLRGLRRRPQPAMVVPPAAQGTSPLAPPE